MAALVEVVAPQQMRTLLHRRIEFELEAGGIGELQRAALERLIGEGIGDAVLRKERCGLVEIAVIADLEAEPAAGRDGRLSQHQRVMLMLLAAAQIHRLVVGVLDMQADGVFVERAALAEVDDVEHGVAAADDVEGGIEDVCRNGHVFPRIRLSFRGGAKHQTRNLEVPGSIFERPGTTVAVKFPASESCASRARARRAWFPCRSRTSNRRRRGRCLMISCRRTASADGGHFRS